MTCCAYSCTQYSLNLHFCTHLRFFHLTPPNNSQELFFFKHHSITAPVGKAHYTLSIQSLKSSDYLRFKLCCVDCCTSTDVTNDVSASTFSVEQSTKKSTTLALIGPNNYGTITHQNIERLPSAVTLLSEPQIFRSALTITHRSVVSWITSVWVCIFRNDWIFFCLR
jgi:hypothetical protein